MAPEEIQLPEEPVAPEPVAEAPAPEITAEPEPQIEVLPYRSLKGDERQLRADALRMLAEDLGYDNPAAILNQLRNGEETQEVWREQRRSARQYQPEQPQYQPQQYQEPRRDAYGQPAQRYAQPQQPDPDDPIETLRQIAARTAALDERQARIDAFIQQQIEEKQAQRQNAAMKLWEETDNAYAELVQRLRAEGVSASEIPARDFLLQEADRMGWFRPDGPTPNVMLDRTYRMLFSEDIARREANRAVQKMRSPKAQVVVPGPKPVAPPAPQNANDVLQGMNARDAINLLPRFNQ